MKERKCGRFPHREEPALRLSDEADFHEIRLCFQGGADHGEAVGIEIRVGKPFPNCLSVFQNGSFYFDGLFREHLFRIMKR